MLGGRRILKTVRRLPELPPLPTVGTQQFVRTFGNDKGGGYGGGQAKVPPGDLHKFLEALKAVHKKVKPADEAMQAARQASGSEPVRKPDIHVKPASQQDIEDRRRSAEILSKGVPSLKHAKWQDQPQRWQDQPQQGNKPAQSSKATTPYVGKHISPAIDEKFQENFTDALRNDGSYERTRQEEQTRSAIGDPWRESKDGIVPIGEKDGKVLQAQLQSTVDDTWGSGKGSSHVFKHFRNKDFNNHVDAVYNYAQMQVFKQDEESLKEQWDWKHRAGELQYDPDDPLLNQDDPLHKIKDAPNRHAQHHAKYNTFVSENKDAKYEGDNWERDRREFNHFNMGFSMQQVPAFNYAGSIKARGYRWAQPPLGNESALYHLNWHEEVADWSHRKKIARQYGPGYLNMSGMPLVDVTDMAAEDLQALREEKQRLRKYRREATEAFETNIVNLGGSNAPSKEQIDELLTDARVKKRQIDLGTATLDMNEGVDDEIAEQIMAPGREMAFAPDYPSAYEKLHGLELWDKQEAMRMRGPGDPDLPEDVKKETFRMFVDCIDKNNSMSPWKRKLAMLMIPKAFGGPQGEFLKDMVDEVEVTRQEWRKKFEPYIIETSTESSQNEGVRATVSGTEELGL